MLKPGGTFKNIQAMMETDIVENNPTASSPHSSK